jgi:hypothetical protein
MNNGQFWLRNYQYQYKEYNEIRQKSQFFVYSAFTKTLIRDIIYIVIGKLAILLIL